MYRLQKVSLSVVREGFVSCTWQRITNPHDAARIVREVIGASDREQMIVLLLDAKHRVTAVHTVSIGTLTSSIVHPREVFKAALLANAAACILAHNHPSGDPEPSAEDKQLTERLLQCGELLGVPVLDHIIVGDAGFSFHQDATWSQQSW